MNTPTQYRLSTITCPNCQSQEVFKLSPGNSQQFYRCPSCSNILKAKSGDCCIFCSFGSEDCFSSEQNLAC
ncbi:hypothetical protein SAMN06295945_1923 [Polynucleobacter meluiroseus]|uniref:Uncharacterized protein n=1 Tax=Polynucleobacter meluiroseus TaxID=1938814 RepID=A0A240E286_9BURK|nr:hypothetical protein SAMN06295945_1923 [Polynucleobacter meluiroseus]